MQTSIRTFSKFKIAQLVHALLFISLIFPQAVMAEDDAAISTGTGWVVAPHFVVTNHHVVGEASQVILVRTDNRKLKADVVMRDPINDVVILKPRKTKLLPKGLPIASVPANVGANVFTIGYPLVGIMGTEPKLTTGFVNARTGIANDPRTYQISIPIQPGNSGGPVFNMKGEVIGIATSSLSAATIFKWVGNIPQNVNYAVKSNYVRALLDASPVHGKQAVETIQPVNGNLETLVQRVKNSIVIVVSGQSGTDPTQGTESTQQPVKLTGKQTYALYVFVKPHNYDLREGNSKKGLDDNTKNYSKNVGKLVKQFIESSSHGNVIIAHEKLGKSAKSFVYRAYKENERIKLCKNKKVDFLFSAMNERFSMGQMGITYYIFDCHSNSDYYYSKDLKENQSDSFMYELHMRKLLRNMFEDKPGNIEIKFN